jgi:excisionase family DNA binding protein
MDITVEEAAQRLGISTSTIKRRLDRGQISGRKIGRQWVVDDSKLPAPTRVESLRSAPFNAVDVTQALQYVKATDLNELWVPDVVRWADSIREPADVLASAAKRAATGTCDAAMQIEVPKTPMLTRPAAILSLADRIAYQALVSALLSATDATLSPRVYSSRATSGPPHLFKKPTKQWIQWHRRVAKEVKAGAVWVAKTDVSAYFESIDHGILFRELAAVGAPEGVLKPLREFLRAWSRTPGRGLPQGPNASRALGNFYLAAVDEAVLAESFNYWRYMDDVMIVAPTKGEATAGIRLFERECRKRGLILSAHKTKLITGGEAARAGGDPDKDHAQYLMDTNQAMKAKKELRRILNTALKDEGNVDVSDATFSLWRLAQLMDKRPLRRILEHLEDLGPVARISAAYLRKFLADPRVEDALSAFLADPARNTSSVTESWLFACMLEHPSNPPVAWTDRARIVTTDRNGPSYLRALAVSVLVLGAISADIAWVKNELRRDYDPEMLRAYLVALARVGELDRVTLMMAANRSPALRPTTEYLRNRSALPSLVWRGQDVKVK